MNKLQIIIFGFCIIIGIIAVIQFAGFSGEDPEKKPLEGSNIVVWGTEPGAYFAPILKILKDEQDSSVAYFQKKPETFDEEITEALATGQGPDVVITGADWIQANQDKLSPIGTRVMSASDYKSTFIDSGVRSFLETTINEQTRKPEDLIWALPLWVDPLVLYWNKSLFNASSIATPPSNWEELFEISQVLRRVDEGSQINRPAIALGRASNIPRFKDIITLLTLQQGGDIESSLMGGVVRENPAESALRFYTDFARVDSPRAYTWNSSMKEPRELFLAGELAMMLDYASYGREIRAKSPHLDFDIATAPRNKGAEVPIHVGRIVGVAVTRASKQQNPGILFARALVDRTINENLMELHRLGPSRRDLYNSEKFSNLASSRILKEAGLNARRPIDRFPDLSRELLAEMIDSITDGKLTISEALTNASKKFKRVAK